MADPTELFQDDELRGDWLTCLRFLRDDEVPTMTYRGWLETVKDTAFDVLTEETATLSSHTLSDLAEYIERVSEIREELMFLNRNGL